MRALTQHPKRRTEQGNVLAVAIVTTGLLLLVVTVYLGLVKAQTNAIMRSQAWNACIAIAEAGIEEALTHARFCYKTGLGTNGWQLNGTDYVMTRYLDSNYFTVRITSAEPYRFTSTGYYFLPGNNTYIARTVQVDTISQGLYSKALVVKNSIEMNGNNVGTDSYDSRDPLKSTLGQYDPLKAQANGDVACQDGLVNSLAVGNADIKGRVITGPAASVAIGPNGTVGGLSWHFFGNHGIEPGYWLTDMNMNFPAVKAPYTSGTTVPSSGSWTHVVDNGNYICSSLSGKMLVKGNATVYVTGNVDYSSTSVIKLQNGANLKLYIAGNTANFGQIQNENAVRNATNLFIYGLNSCKKVDIKYNTDFMAVVYAPNANLDLNGGMELYGSIVCKNVKMNGHSKFHYDEALSGEGQPRGFIVSSWNEL